MSLSPEKLFPDWPVGDEAALAPRSLSAFNRHISAVAFCIFLDV